MTGQASALGQHLWSLVGRQRDATLPDAQLLERFVQEHDEGAFAVLVERHGPLVLQVCRRVLHDRHAADDAFQATFLVLVRKAASIRKAELLGNWLYGVAFRTARRAKADAARRASRESRVPPSTPVDSLAELSARELCAVLDEELERLPSKYRDPFFLCFIQGQTRDQAARQLGSSLRTLHRRLERARKLLHARLTRRGLTLSVALAALGLTQQGARAAVPSLVASATIRMARLCGAGKAHAAGACSATALALADRVGRSMMLIKLKTMAALVAAACLIATGAGVLLHEEPTAPAVAVAVSAVDETKHAAVPSEKEEVLVDRHGDPLPAGALARLGTTRFRQGSIVYCAAFSPDSKSIAAASAGEGGIVWETATGKELLQLQPNRHIYALAYTPDGNLVAGAGLGFGLFDVRTGAELRHFEGNQQGATMALAVSPDGKWVASGGHDFMLRLWETASGKEIRQFEGHTGSVLGVAFSPDGKLLASASLDKTVRLWDMATGKPAGVLTGHEDRVKSVAFAPDGKKLASCSEDGTVRMWDAISRRPIHVLQAKAGQVGSIAFSPDGKMLCSGHRDGTLHLWDVAGGVERLHWKAHTYQVHTTAFSGDGKFLVSGAAQDCGPRLWHATTGKEVDAFVQHRGAIDWMSFTADGKKLLSASRDRVILQWDIASQNPEPWFTWPSSGLDWFAVSLRSGQLVTSGHAERMRIWDLTSKAAPRPLGPRESRGPGFNREMLAFSPDGRIIASGNTQGVVVLWDAATGAQLRQLHGLHEGVFAIAFSPDGAFLAAAAGAQGKAGAICLWHVATGQVQHSLVVSDYSGELAFSPDSKLLATTGGYQSRARLWDVASGRLLRSLGIDRQGYHALVFSPDGKWLAGGDLRNQAAHLWEVETGQEALQFQGHRSGPSSLTYSPDGRILASGGWESMILLWDVTGRVRNGRLQQPTLTPSDWETRWKNLAGEASQAQPAIWELVASPQAVAYLRGRVRPVQPVDSQRVTQLINDLDNANFGVRKKAMSQLQEIGEVSKAALNEALKKKPTLEARQRIEQLLAQMDPAASPERLRSLRAVQVLEHTGSAEAKRLLQELAGGEARLTQEAAASLRRLTAR